MLINQTAAASTTAQHLGGLPPQMPARSVASNELLRGDKSVGILHNGSVYRLQATKLGKLILTK